MKASMLSAALKTFPDDAEVYAVWDGSARTKIDVVWLAQGREHPLDGGCMRVLLAGEHDVVYDDENRPVEAPSQAEDRYWMAGSVAHDNKKVER